jgi:DNA polymerase
MFRYQPPANKVDHLFISRRAAKELNIGVAEKWGQFGNAWCRAEFAGEIENLQATLMKTGPKIIFGLGRTSLWALTGENGLMEKLGKPLPCRMMQGVKVIPTFHPSFILRGNWGRQDEWLNHFLAATEYMK